MTKYGCLRVRVGRAYELQNGNMNKSMLLVAKRQGRSQEESTPTDVQTNARGDMVSSTGGSLGMQQTPSPTPFSFQLGSVVIIIPSLYRNTFSTADCTSSGIEYSINA